MNIDQSWMQNNINWLFYDENYRLQYYTVWVTEFSWLDLVCIYLE